MSADRTLACPTCGPQPHRWQPSPEAGPHWRCSVCGDVTESIGETGAEDEPGATISKMEIVESIGEAHQQQLDVMEAALDRIAAAVPESFEGGDAADYIEHLHELVVTLEGRIEVEADRHASKTSSAVHAERGDQGDPYTSLAAAMMAPASSSEMRKSRVGELAGRECPDPETCALGPGPRDLGDR